MLTPRIRSELSVPEDFTWRRSLDSTPTGDALDPWSRSFNLDAARRARDEAYAAYDREQENAWRRDRERNPR